MDKSINDEYRFDDMILSVCQSFIKTRSILKLKEQIAHYQDQLRLLLQAKDKNKAPAGVITIAFFLTFLSKLSLPSRETFDSAISWYPVKLARRALFARKLLELSGTVSSIQLPYC